MHQQEIPAVTAVVVPSQPSLDCASSIPNPPGEAWAARGTTAYRRISLALFLVGFSTFSLVYAVQPLLPLLVPDFHVSPPESSLALSLTTGFMAFSILCAAVLSASVGRRGLMFASMAGAAALHIASAVVPGWDAMLLLRALEGFVLGGVPAVAMAYLAEEIEPKSLGGAMGLYVAGTAVGAMMGRLGVGVLLEFAHWRVAFGAMGAVGLMFAVAFVILLPPSRNFSPRRGLGFRHHRDAWLGHLRTPGLPLLFLTGGIPFGINVMSFNYLTFRLTGAPFDLSHAAVSSIFAVFLLGAVASTVAGMLADRWSRGPVVIGGALTMAAGIALTLSSALVAIIAGVVLVTVGFFVCQSVSSGWVGRMAKEAKGHASSLYMFVYYVGVSIIGSVGGLFWTGGGWGAVAGFAALMLAIVLAAAIRLHIIERR